MKQFFYFFVILAVFVFLIGCGSRDVSLTISETQPSASPAQAEAIQSGSSSGADQTRPLIVIQPQDTLQIYVRSDGAPGMYLGDDKQVHGFYVDLEKMLMQQMGQKYQFVAYDNVGPVVQKMKTGEAHSALAVPDLPDYHALANLSNAYETLSFYTFVRSGEKSIGGATREAVIKSLSGKQVGVQTRGHIYQTLREFKDIKMLEYPTTTEAMKDLAAGKLDAVPEVRENGQYYAKKNGWDVLAVGQPIASYKDTTGFSKALDPSILQRYNQALAVIKADGRFQKLYDSYFGK